MTTTPASVARVPWRISSDTHVVEPPESTFPRSEELLAATFRDVPRGEQALMVRDNCTRFFGFGQAVVERKATELGA